MSDTAKLAGFLQAQITELTHRRNAAIAQAVNEERDSLRTVAAATGLDPTHIGRIARKARG